MADDDWTFITGPDDWSRHSGTYDHDWLVIQPRSRWYRIKWSIRHRLDRLRWWWSER